MPFFLVSILIVATCGLIYELISGSLASYLMGDSITQFSLVIGLYLFAMGVGSYISKNFTKNIGRTFVCIEIALGLIGGFSATILMELYFASLSFQVALLCVVFVIGLLVGTEIPLAMRLLKEKFQFDHLVSKVLSLDYLGALAASILFPLVMIPTLGILRTAYFFGGMNVIAAGLSTFDLEKHGFLNRKRPLLISCAVAGFILTIGFIYAPRMERYFDGIFTSGIAIYTKSTPYQKVQLVKNGNEFRLFLNGNLQFSSADEYRYHEALVHPGLAAMKDPKHILILGGGDGLAAREILRYPSVESITLIDLDPEMTRLFKNDPQLVALNQKSLLSSKLKVINDDAFQWLKKDQNQYDFAVIDFPDPSNFAIGKLYSTTFFQQLKQRLAPNARFVVQSSSPYYAKKSFWCVVQTIKEMGFQTIPYHAYVPSFGDWGFVLGSFDEYTTPNEYPEKLRYVNLATVQAMLQFPPDQIEEHPEVNRLTNQMLVRLFNEEWNEKTKF